MRSLTSPHPLLTPCIGIVFPIMFFRLFLTIGFGRSVCIVAFICLGVLISCIVLIKPRLPPRKVSARLWVDSLKPFIRDPMYRYLSLASFFGCFG
jgi:hypothetical protein